MSYMGQERAILAAQGGEYVTDNPNAVPVIFARKLRNVTLQNDMWETEPGTRRLNPLPIGGEPTVGTLVQFFPSLGVERLIACCRNGTIWKSDNGGRDWTELVSGLTPEGHGGRGLMVPVEGGQEEMARPKKLFIFGGGAPQVITGDADFAAGIPDPTERPAVVTVNGIGTVNDGEHEYAYTWLTVYGESAPSPRKSIITSADAGKTDVTVEDGPEGTISKRLYRTASGDGTLKLLTTMAQGERVYRDNKGDTELAATVPPTHNATAAVHRIARPPADWAGGVQPTGGFILEGRMCAYMGHFIYVSLRDDHEDFLSQPITFPVYTGKGEAISGGVYWRQQGWLFKRPKGIYRVDCTDIDPDLWQVKEHTDAIGCAGPLAFAKISAPQGQQQVFDDVIFLSPMGSWHRLSKALAMQEGDVDVSSISEETYGPFIRDNVDLPRLPFAQMVYVDALEEIQAAVTPKGGTINTLRIKANMKRILARGFRFHHADFPECEALALKVDNDGVGRPIAGASLGRVLQLHQAVYTNAHEAYGSEFRTWEDDFADLGEGMRISKKNYHFLVIEGIAVGSFDLTIEVYIDGVLQPRLLTVSLRGTDSGALELNGGTLGTQHLNPSKPLRVRKRLRGRGYRIAFRGYNETAEKFFKITRLLVLFDAGGFTGANT